MIAVEEDSNEFGIVRQAVEFIRDVTLSGLER